MLVVKMYCHSASSELREVDNSKEHMEKHYYFYFKFGNVFSLIQGLTITSAPKEPQAIRIAFKTLFCPRKHYLARKIVQIAKLY